MSTTNNKHPENLAPTGTICVPVSLPDDGDWWQVFLDAVEIPTLQRYWTDTLDGNRDELRKNWESLVYLPLLDAMVNGDSCTSDNDGSLGSCYRLDTTTEAFSYYPNDPFTDKNNDAGKILAHTKFMRFGDLPINDLPLIGDFINNILNGVSGYFDNDIFITEDLLSPFDNPLERLGDMVSQITSFPLPMVTIELEGAGQLEVELVNVPEGGSVLLIPDLDVSLQGVWNTVVDLVDNDGSLPASWMLTEVNRNIAGLELVATQVQEFEYTEDSTHTMHVIFIPIPKIIPPFINMFGGIREIEVCGSLRIIGTQTGTEINKSNSKSETHIREGIIAMTTYDDLLKALNEHRTIEANRWLLASSADNIGGGVTIDKDTGEITIDSASGLTAPEFSTTLSEIKNGGAYNQAVQFAKLFTDTDSQITAGFSDNLIVKSLQYVMHAPALISFVIADYVTTASPVIIDVGKLAESIYCTGSFSNGLFEYASDPANHGEDDFGYILDMAQDLENSALSQWYADGKTSPRNDFVNYPCYRQPVLVGTVDFSEYNSASTANLIFQQNTFADRQWRMELSGKYVDATGREYDGVFLSDDGSLTRNQVKIIQYQQADASASNQPTYNADGYALTYSMPTKSPDGIWTQQAFVPVSGSITYSLYDLGGI